MTNKAIVTPVIRQMYAKELLGLRNANRRMGLSWQDQWMIGIKLGLETVFRRMQRMINVGAIDPNKIDINDIYQDRLTKERNP